MPRPPLRRKAVMTQRPRLAETGHAFRSGHESCGGREGQRGDQGQPQGIICRPLCTRQPRGQGGGAFVLADPGCHPSLPLLFVCPWQAAAWSQGVAASPAVTCVVWSAPARRFQRAVRKEQHGNEAVPASRLCDPEATLSLHPVAWGKTVTIVFLRTRLVYVEGGKRM